MRESILLFHISDKEVKKKVERALLPLRVRIRHIALKDYSQPLGVLAGLPDMTPSEEIYDGEELSDAMLVFCGLSNQKLDQALLALKKSFRFVCASATLHSKITASLSVCLQACRT